MGFDMDPLAQFLTIVLVVLAAASLTVGALVWWATGSFALGLFSTVITGVVAFWLWRTV